MPCDATGEHGDKWKNTKVFPNYQAMLEDAASKPTAAFIGVPPTYHGAREDPKANIEVSKTLQLSTPCTLEVCLSSASHATPLLPGGPQETVCTVIPLLGSE